MTNILSDEEIEKIKRNAHINTDKIMPHPDPYYERCTILQNQIAQLAAQKAVEKILAKVDVNKHCKHNPRHTDANFCVHCPTNIEIAREEGAQAERERWKKAICATDTIDAPEGGVIGVKAYWVDLEKLKEQGVEL